MIIKLHAMLRTAFVAEVEVDRLPGGSGDGRDAEFIWTVDDVKDLLHDGTIEPQWKLEGEAEFRPGSADEDEIYEVTT